LETASHISEYASETGHPYREESLAVLYSAAQNSRSCKH